jgi:hypothetical protein
LANPGQLQDVSMQRGLETERVWTDVRDEPGWYYIVVLGYNGAYMPYPPPAGSESRQPYRLQVDISPPAAGVPVCTTTLPFPPGPLVSPVSPNQDPRSLILLDKQRLNAAFGQIPADALMQKLITLANDPSVSAILYPIENDPAIAAAYAAWDANACDPAAANAVAKAIKDRIKNILADHPSIEYLVIVGDDSQIPFRRVPDAVEISNESAYRRRAGVRPDTPLFYSLTEGYTLTDDYYADLVPYSWLGRELYVPDLPIGRLVETPAEITQVINAYLANDGSVNALRGFVVGYDFLTDASLAIQGVMETQGLDTTSLISNTWTADEMRMQFLGSRHEINSINAHFEHWHAWPADVNSGDFTSIDLKNSGVDLRGAVVFSVGCHSGLSVPDGWDADGRSLDFSQVSAGRGTTYVANTGYGYGLDDAVSLSELLMWRFTRELGQIAAMPVGQALLQAKQHYFNNVGANSFGLYDEKVMIEATLYGLPMLKVSLPNAEGSGTPAPLRATITSPLSTGDGLITRTVTITPAFQEVTTANGRFFSADGEVQANAGRPIQPRTSQDISIAGLQAHGALFLAGSYTDVVAFDPMIARPVTDTALTEPAFVYEGWYPAQMAAINRLEVATGTVERLVVIPAQYANPGAERLYNSLTYQVYYSTDEDQVAPTIWRAEAGQVPGRASFSLDVTDSSGIERVVVTYDLDDGRWHSFDLAYDAARERWWGELTLAGKSVNYFVQAVDKAGNVASSNNKGLFFEPVTHEAYLPVVIRSNLRQRPGR